MNTTNTRLKIRPHFLLMFVIICTSISAVFSQQTISSNCASPTRMDVHIRGILNQGNKNITLDNGTNKVTMECVCRDMVDDGIEMCPNTVVFTIRKPNGTMQNVTASRETVNIDDDDRFPSRIYRVTYTGSANRVTYNAPPSASRPSMRGLVVWQESVGNGTPNVPNNYEVDRFFYDTQVSPLPFYDISVPQSSSGNSRNLVVHIPVHEHGNNDRPIIYRVRGYNGNTQVISSGDIPIDDDNYQGEIRLDQINLNNVPASVNRVRVEIRSPLINHPFYGASVVVGSIMVTSTPCCVPVSLNCPSNITRSADVGSCDYTVQGGELNATWTGTCPVTLTNDYNNNSTLAGAIFPLGTTTVTWSVGTTTCQTTITVTDSTGTGICEYVWPGDFNYDGRVTERDVLHLGRAYNFSGPPRPAAASDWSAQVANLWIDSIDDVNSMHQDGNGDGTVDESDIDVVYQNFGLEHNLTPSPFLMATLRYEFVRRDSTSGIYDLYIEDSAGDDISMHGISLVIDFGDIEVIEPGIDTAGSSLQPDIIFQWYDASSNKLYITLTRTDRINRLCDGPVASLVVIADNVASKTIHLRDGVGMQADGTVKYITDMSMYSTDMGFVSLAKSMETEDINIEVLAHHAQCSTMGHAEVNAYDGTPPYSYAWCTGANTPKITGLTAGAYQVTVTDANNNTKDLSFEVEDLPIHNCNTVFPDIHVLLEGAYDMASDTMSTHLQQMDILSIHPYTEATWNYTGMCDLSWTPDDYPDHSVDWVLVSFCKDATRNNQIAQVAAILKKDGSLYFPDGGVRFVSPTDSMYVIIEHRNHMAVMTPQPIPIIDNALTYDFCMSDSYNSLGYGQKQLLNDKWVMYAGNCAQIRDTVYDINGSDKILWDMLNGSFGDYFAPDFNLDGDVNGKDKWLWQNNNGIYSSVPK